MNYLGRERFVAWTALLSMVLAVPLIVFAADFPICNHDQPDDDPPFCLEPFSTCEDHFDAKTCTVVPTCIGEYPDDLPKTCEPGGGQNKHCDTCPNPALCYKKADCHWDNGQCVQDEWCQVTYAKGKCDLFCTEAGS